MLGDVEFVDGRYICPSHQDTGIKYFMEYMGRGKYRCPGDQSMPTSAARTRLMVPCPTTLYVKSTDDEELTRAASGWKFAFRVMTAAFTASFVVNLITVAQVFGLLP